MSSSSVGIYDMLSASLERFFRGFRFAVGGRYVDLAHDLTWGVLLSGSTVIAEIARAVRTDPSRPLAYVEDRLSKGLASRGWDDSTLTDALTRHNARGMTERSLLVVDLTDLAKPYAKKMDDLCIVRDGSRHCKCPGYWAVVVFLERVPHDLLPLRVVPFSTEAKGFMSQNHVVFGVLRAVKKCLPAGRVGVTLEDRGFDGDKHFEFFVQEGWPFIIRLRGDRHVTGLWGAQRADRVAATYLGGASWRRGEKACIVPVGLPDVAGRFFLVGYEHQGHAHQMFLLVYEVGGEPVEEPLRYAHLYLHRWGGEDWIRLIKQRPGLEKFLARSANARSRLGLAAESALTFATELNGLNEAWVEEIKELAEDFGEEVKSEISRLLRGIRELARRPRDARERRAA